MAKTTAPLFGFAATGSLGQSIVFASWRGVNYARRHVVPANPKTAAQTVTRTTFATLREMWKIMPPDGRTPWDAFASGRKFLGLNAFIGENMRVVRGDGDFKDFIGSPGARGGLPPTTVGFAQGSSTGEIDFTFTNPTPPSGWVLDSETSLAFPDQDPEVVFGGPLVVGNDDPPTGTNTLAGLGANVSCVCSGWITWVKPNLDLAYSVSVVGLVNSGA